MEADRMNEFVKSAWIDQRKWKEDEMKRQKLEDDKIEQEAEVIREEQEKREKLEAKEKQQKRQEFQEDIERQLTIIKYVATVFQKSSGSSYE